MMIVSLFSYLSLSVAWSQWCWWRGYNTCAVDGTMWLINQGEKVVMYQLKLKCWRHINTHLLSHYVQTFELNIFVTSPTPLSFYAW